MAISLKRCCGKTTAISLKRCCGKPRTLRLRWQILRLRLRVQTLTHFSQHSRKTLVEPIPRHQLETTTRRALIIVARSAKNAVSMAKNARERSIPRTLTSKLTTFWPFVEIEVNLGSTQDRFGFILGSTWNRPGLPSPGTPGTLGMPDGTFLTQKVPIDGNEFVYHLVARFRSFAE